MDRLQEKIISILRCPICSGKIDFHNSSCVCIQCNLEYPIIDGIFDFYPSQNIFEPRGVLLKEKYETFGKTVYRADIFESNRRKHITLDMIEGDNILEIGSAEGWLTKDIAKKAKFLLASDISLNYLRRAKAEGCEATFARIDTHFLPFENESFDCIVITEVIEHVFSPYRVLEEVYRVLTKHGIMILSTPNQLFPPNILQHVLNKPLKDYDLHLSFYDPHALIKFLNFVGFSVIEYKTAFFYVPPLKPLFFSRFIQKFCALLFKNFGDKIIIKAKKSNRILWEDR